MTPFQAVSVGAVSGLHRDNARTGIHLAFLNTGTSRWGTYASARFDSVAGLDLVYDEAEGDDNDDEDRRFDEYQGAFVYNMGFVFRPANRLALYLGGGIGNFYNRSIEDRNGRASAILTTVFWQGNLQSGAIWMFDPNGGLDFGYETFDESWHLAVVFNQ
ncbi:MAG: hypothetical protein O3A95_06225 [Planctomycetota bacterium]|nr:hypothetical protein [Planctomycetota bacterium]MDA1113879.1 hypothetical protein [Planctomycetota bacterium]